MANDDTRAAKDFYDEIRRFAERAQPWQQGIVWYETKPDERFDLSLVAARVYGRRDEYLAVLAAAGLDGFDQPLTERIIALPSEFRLTAIKRATNFESVASMRSLAVGVKDAPLPEPKVTVFYPTPDGLPTMPGGNDDAAYLLALHVSNPNAHPQYIDRDDPIDGGTY
jgi:hypothetical protein